MADEKAMAASADLELAIFRYLHETGMDTGELEGMIPQSWYVMVGFSALEVNDDNASGGVCAIPKEGQPLFLSLGLLTYGKARLEGMIMDCSSES